MKDHHCIEGAASYEPPRLVSLGSVHALTLSGKNFGLTDGDWFVPTGQGLATVS